MPPKNFALDCDWVLVSNNALYKGGLPDALNPKKIIFDASNSFYFIEKALIKAQERHLHTHVIREQGAYIAQIQ